MFFNLLQIKCIGNITVADYIYRSICAEVQHKERVSTVLRIYIHTLYILLVLVHELHPVLHYLISFAPVELGF